MFLAYQSRLHAIQSDFSRIIFYPVPPARAFHSCRGPDHCSGFGVISSLFDWVTYEIMDAAFRPTAQTGTRLEWIEPLARRIDAAKKYVVSSTVGRVDWNRELVRGDRR
jgi:hypothetical protein